MAVVALRAVDDQDLGFLFRMMADPEAVRMAAFTAEDPSDRARFDAHMARVRTDPEVVLRAITCDGRLVGSAPGTSGLRQRPRTARDTRGWMASA